VIGDAAGSGLRAQEAPTRAAEPRLTGSRASLVRRLRNTAAEASATPLLIIVGPRHRQGVRRPRATPPARPAGRREPRDRRGVGSATKRRQRGSLARQIDGSEARGRLLANGYQDPADPNRPHAVRSDLLPVQPARRHRRHPLPATPLDLLGRVPPRRSMSLSSAGRPAGMSSAEYWGGATDRCRGGAVRSLPLGASEWCRERTAA
jgi:hypothetical protein